MFSIRSHTLPDLQKRVKHAQETFTKIVANREKMQAKDSASKKELQSLRKSYLSHIKHCGALAEKAKTIKKDPKVEDLDTKRDEEIEKLEVIQRELSSWMEEGHSEADGISLGAASEKSTAPSESEGSEFQDVPLESTSEPEPSEGQTLENVDEQVKQEGQEQDEESEESEEQEQEQETENVQHKDDEEEEDQKETKPIHPVPVPAPRRISRTDNAVPEAVPSSASELSATEKDENFSQPMFEVIHDFLGSKRTQLPLLKGEMVHILQTRNDGWWKVRNEQGDVGLVPVNALKPPSNYAEIAEIEEADPVAAPVPKAVVPEIPEYKAPTKPDIIVEAPNDKIQTQQAGLGSSLSNGMVPSRLWQLLSSDIHLGLVCHLSPRLSESNLGFHDLYWSDDMNKLLKRRVRVSKCFRLIRCEGVPAITAQVQQRCVRICLFDGHQVLSNVHTIAAQFNPAKPNIWTFTEKLTDNKSILEHAEFFVRSNYSKSNVVALIELAVAYTNEQTNRQTWVTVAYSTLPLMTDKTGRVTPTSGTHPIDFVPEAVENKKYELTLQFGCPFASGARSQPTTPSKHSAKLLLRAYNPGQNAIETLDSLPDVLIWHTNSIQFTYLYRQLLGQVLIKDRQNVQKAERIPNSFLATFPRIVEQPDLLDLLRTLWPDRSDKFKKRKDAKQRTEEALWKDFSDFFLETAFLVHSTLLLPNYQLGNIKTLQERQEAIRRFAQMYKDNKMNALPWIVAVTSEDHPFRPLNIFDLTVDLIGPHSID